MKFAIVNDYYVSEIVETDVEQDVFDLYGTSQAIINIDGLSPEPQKNWSFDGTKLNAPLTSQQIEAVAGLYYDPIVNGFNAIKRRFIAENIALGINQKNKTRIVAEFMQPIQTWFDRYAPYPTIEEIEKAKLRLKNDSALKVNLAPFITIGRLDWYKEEILKAIGG